MASRGASLRRRRPLRIAVASDQALVAEAVVMALRNRALAPLLVRWPGAGRDATATGPRRTTRRAVGPPPDVGLLLSDLLRVEQALAAQIIVTSLPLPWLVMAGAPRGPVWGALYDKGATLVLPDDTGLDEVCDLLVEMAAGRKPRAPRRDRQRLIQGWRDFAAQRQEITARLESLTDREEEILHELHQGLGVRGIAEKSDITEATVRSHVKAILKKLEVTSQMAAVAAYENVLNDSTRPDPG
jgi:DNA-binding NarL/FixJ family response regulator